MTAKAKIIVSDLHLGAGRREMGNVLEDFTADGEFARLLAEARQESEAQGLEFELIIAGDMMEFLQVPAVDTYDPGRKYDRVPYRPSSQAASLQRVEHIIQGHSEFFHALRDFVQSGAPRRWITIVKGNHDINLYWPGVRDRIRQVVGATGLREGLLVFEKRSISREGLYVEHGNQYAEKLNHVRNFEEPLDSDREGELDVPAGSQFVIEFFNDLEWEKWWADSVKPFTALIWYGFAVDFNFAARALIGFLKVAPILLLGTLGVRAEGLSAERDELLAQLENEVEREAMGRRYADDEAFRQEFNARLVRMMEGAGVPGREAVSRGAMVALEEASAFGLGKSLINQVSPALVEAAEAKAQETGARVVVFGHTHKALCKRLPSGGLYLNSGTWTWWRDFGEDDLETWKRFYADPEAFVSAPFLTYVRVDYDSAGVPHARVIDYSGQMIIEGPQEAAPRAEGCFWRLARLLQGGQ